MSYPRRHSSNFLARAFWSLSLSLLASKTGSMSSSPGSTPAAITSFDFVVADHIADRSVMQTKFHDFLSSAIAARHAAKPRSPTGATAPYERRSAFRGLAVPFYAERNLH